MSLFFVLILESNSKEFEVKLNMKRVGIEGGFVLVISNVYSFEGKDIKFEEVDRKVAIYSKEPDPNNPLPKSEDIVINPAYQEDVKSMWKPKMKVLFRYGEDERLV